MKIEIPNWVWCPKSRTHAQPDNFGILEQPCPRCAEHGSNEGRRVLSFEHSDKFNEIVVVKCEAARKKTADFRCHGKTRTGLFYITDLQMDGRPKDGVYASLSESCPDCPLDRSPKKDLVITVVDGHRLNPKFKPGSRIAGCCGRMPKRN